ncbi:hypothetical protein BC830DRAFT_1152735 [Chytriomyces sp. MP71]|nr:hypothetical protein BC830DRAFT_1152735 [Chytriomyces sp. MP71]
MPPSSQVTAELYDLFHLCGLEANPRVFGILVQLVRIGVPPDNIVAALKLIATENAMTGIPAHGGE